MPQRGRQQRGFSVVALAPICSASSLKWNLINGTLLLAGNMQLCSPRIGVQTNSCSDLGLSPSLFSSPGRLLTRHLQGTQEEFSPGKSPESSGGTGGDQLCCCKSKFAVHVLFLFYLEDL